MDEQTPDGSGDGAGEGPEPPKFFRNINAWIGGLTGVVIALAGLYSAIERFWPDTPVQSAAEPAVDASANASTGNEADEDATAAALPLSYKAVDATFEKTGGMWVYTRGEEVTRYQEVSRDDGKTVVFDPMRKVYARWPNAGGMVEESANNQASWSDSFDVWVPEADAADAPAG